MNDFGVYRKDDQVNDQMENEYQEGNWLTQNLSANDQ